MSDDTILRELVLPRLENIKKVAGGYQARCPAHEDNEPSLSLAVGTEQPVVMFCHAGCDRDTILGALGLTWDDLCKPRDDNDRQRDASAWSPAGPASAVYDYRDERGELLFQVLRIPQPGGGKTFRQRVPDATAPRGYRWNLNGIRRVPYRLPQLIEAVAGGEVVYIVEGEKDADTLARMDIAATTSPQGAGKWRPEYAEHFKGATVIIVADKDGPGQKHARLVAESLYDVADSVTIVEAAEGKDVTDHLAAGRKLNELVTTWASEVAAPPELAPDLHEFLSVEDPPEDWIIPDLLERGDRLIWTGFEGLGKSVALRQIAVCAAAGIHPFTERSFPPVNVLVIDCENNERQNRPHYRRIERVTRLRGQRVPDGGFRIIHRPAGIDLTKDDKPWLLERVTAHKPDLLVIGPLYRLHNQDINDERAARAVVTALDEARLLVDCALVIEAHSGHGTGNGSRPVRPVGSSLFMRWPEFGMGLAPATDEFPPRDVLVKPWRGNRSERKWPTELCRNIDPNGFPWADPNAPLMRLRAVPDMEESS